MYTRLPCLPRVATPDPQLAVVCFRREVQMASTVSAYNNYFVTIFQRGGWSLVSAKSAAEMDCSSEMASYRCNPYQIIVEIILRQACVIHIHICSP
jgi:hypothetical protein